MEGKKLMFVASMSVLALCGLVAGEKIPVTYLTNNPKRVLYSNYRGPNPWPWLIVGLGALATAIYATRLFKREHGRE